MSGEHLLTPAEQKARGIPRGTRKADGEAYARAVLEQSEEEVLVTTGADGEPVVCDRNPRAVDNLVIRQLRLQARNGVGTRPDQLPPAVFTHLQDRAYGKTVDKLKVGDGKRPLASASEDELKERLRSRLVQLDAMKTKEA